MLRKIEPTASAFCAEGSGTLSFVLQRTPLSDAPAVTIRLPVPAVGVAGCVAPFAEMEHAVMVVVAVPLLVRSRVHTRGAVPSSLPVQVTTWALTWAVLVNDPNRPNTNPIRATAAMSVIAIRITVARIGEMASRLLVTSLNLIEL